ncbi:MAG: Trm112 family protein [Proteobacteria bacterium]|nr:Trm112 family protein [Pseudomonadota bacterium]
MTDDVDDSAPDDANAVDPKLLELLVCPLTKTRLVYDASKRELLSKAAGLAFPIRNGVPLMIEDAARKLTDEDLRRL